jgi:hypothetical protein
MENEHVCKDCGSNPCYCKAIKKAGPFSDGLSAEQLTEAGYYWWLPQCDIGKTDDACWNIINWHPKNPDSRKGIFVGPLKKPSI